MGYKEICTRVAAGFLTGALMIAMPGTTAFASAGQTDAAARVEEMARALPDKADLTEANGKTVQDVMQAYWALNMAEKASIDPEIFVKLNEEYNICISAGYIEDLEKEAKEKQEEQERAAQDQAAMPASNATETNATDYIFTIAPDAPSVSITIRFITDVNGDGYGDAPASIILTTPDGESFSVTQAEKEVKREGLSIMYQWETNFVQLDVAEAQNGNWKIETSEPVVFSSMPYAGVRQNIEPADTEKEEDAADTNLTEIKPEEEDNSSPLTVVFVAAAFGLIGFLGFKFGLFGGGKKGSSKKKAKKEDDDEENDFARPLSDEEVAAQMRAEYEERKKAELAEDEPYDSGYEPEESDNDSDDDDDDTTGFEVYNEGESGLLNAENNPFRNGSGSNTDDEDEDEENFFDDEF